MTTRAWIDRSQLYWSARRPLVSAPLLVRHHLFAIACVVVTEVPPSRAAPAYPGSRLGRESRPTSYSLTCDDLGRSRIQPAFALYPTPRTVTTISGCSGSCSILE